MHTSSVFSILILVIVAFFCSDVCSTGTCESPQFLELYKRGIINCEFDEFFRVLWYNTTEYLESDPILDYKNTIKTGVGYASGEFDVYPNGSLIINRVSRQHEVFTVAYLHLQTDVPIFIPIHVVVVDRPDVAFPVINLCGNESKYCFSQIDSSSVKCKVSTVRPEVKVNLYARTIDGDKNISSELSIIADPGGHTSSVTSVDVFRYSRLLALLVCKASSPPGILKSSESMILVQNGDIGPWHDNLTVRYIERNRNMKLECTDKDTGFVVWKKMSTNSTSKPDVLLSSLFFGEMVTEIYAEDVSVDGQGSLVIPRIQVKHEGRYICIYGNGLSDTAILYDLNVIVYPVTAYPLVDGCNQQEYCAMEVQHDGILKCTVGGIRPLVQLEWRTYNRDDEPAIVLSNQQQAITETGETFDVTLTTTYTVKNLSLQRLLLECVMSGPSASLRFSSKVYLLFVRDKTQSPKSQSSLIWVVVVMGIVICTLLGILICTLICKRRLPKSHDTVLVPLTEETPDNANLTVKKNQFLEELRDSYAHLYRAIQPVPYVKDKLCCVSRVFVEGGVEILEDMKGPQRLQWVKLDSCNDVFDVPVTRRIIEGGPGYGKSTITLKFAYDWCTRNRRSVLKNVDILILLKLRQLAGIKSIYKAIKQLLLLDSSKLGEEDIRQILLNSSSVLIIFDGFDEYPGCNDEESEINKIIAGKIFKDFEVILTTGTSILPHDYPPMAKRYRLTGFDANARESYIHRAVESDDDNAVHSLKDVMTENPILSDYGHIPMFFVLYAHTKFERQTFMHLNSIETYSAKNIIDYLSNCQRKTKWIILCILGYTEKIENVEKPFRDIFDNPTDISAYDDMPLQRLCLHLMEIAAVNQIPISEIRLYNCIQSVVSSTEDTGISIVSGITIAPEIPVKILTISQFSRKMTEDEIFAILEFSAMCPSLRILNLQISVPPTTFEVGSTLETLKSRNVQVSYTTSSTSEKFFLNLLIGQWTKKNGQRCTDTDFRIKESEWWGMHNWTDEQHKFEMKKSREQERTTAFSEQIVEATWNFFQSNILPSLSEQNNSVDWDNLD